MAEPVDIRVPFATMLKIALFALLVLIVIKLWPVILMIVIAAQLAIVLDPLVGWLERHHLRRGAGIAIVGVLLFLLLGVFLFAVVPATVSQLQELGRQAPRVIAQAQQQYPAADRLVKTLKELSQHPLTGAEAQRWFTRGMAASLAAAEALTAIVLILVMTIYLLIEGRRVVDWLVAFTHGARRARMQRTIEQVNPIVFAYMRGQAITCFLCGGVALTTLGLLHVPGAVALAVVAFLADLVPVVGTIIMTIPAVAMALIVSPVKALIVLAVYMAYHLIESYVIIPRVYGSQMKLSTLTVLLAVLVGATLQGALGAILILPFVAAYPVIEKIWLTQQLGSTIREHEEIENESSPEP